MGGRIATLNPDSSLQYVWPIPPDKAMPAPGAPSGEQDVVEGEVVDEGEGA